jgi:SdpC family antimicrobial peptide
VVGASPAAWGNEAHPGSRVVDRSLQTALPAYSDNDVLRLLLAGTGPIAEKHPALVRQLGFDPDRPLPPKRKFNRLVNDYLAFDAAFHKTTVPALLSDDPLRVDAALRSFSVTFVHFLESKGLTMQSTSKFDAQARGWFYKGAYVAVYANAVALANAGVYANVAAATNAVATLVITWFYLPDYSPKTQFQRDGLVADLTDALA